MRFEMSRVGPFMRHTSLVHADIVTDAAIRQMANGGVTAVSLRTLADEFRVSPQAVRQWFGSTEEMWDQIVRRFAARWVSSLTDPWRVDPRRSAGERLGFHHLLPFDAEDVAATRAWLATTQLARDNEAKGAALAAYEAREIEIITDMADRFGLDLDPISVDVLVATTRGLRHAVCATERPMSLARAHAVLSHVVAWMPASASGHGRGDRPLF